MESHWETACWLLMGQMMEIRWGKHSQKENHWVKEWGLPRATRMEVP